MIKAYEAFCAHDGYAEAGFSFWRDQDEAKKIISVFPITSEKKLG